MDTSRDIFESEESTDDIMSSYMDILENTDKGWVNATRLVKHTTTSIINYTMLIMMKH